MKQLVEAFEKAKKVVVASRWSSGRHHQGQGRQLHGECGRLARQDPNREELDAALKEMGLTERIPVEKLLESREELPGGAGPRAGSQNAQILPRLLVERGRRHEGQDGAHPQRLRQVAGGNGGDERIVCLGLDISGSITISDFYAGKPERAKRWISMGIAEQSATSAAAGFAKEGKLPVLGSYATFMSARNLDQIRVSICYGNFNVLIAGAHGGVSVGPDGATHQALEDLFAMQGLPNMSVVVPCDIEETRKATDYLLLQHVGPKVHSLCPRGHARRHQSRDAVCLWQGQRDSPAQGAANFADAFEPGWLPATKTSQRT
jgi:transketolase